MDQAAMVKLLCDLLFIKVAREQGKNAESEPEYASGGTDAGMGKPT